MDISFQLLLYISKVKYQEDQRYCSLNFSDVIVLKFIGELIPICERKGNGYHG